MHAYGSEVVAGGAAAAQHDDRYHLTAVGSERVPVLMVLAWRHARYYGEQVTTNFTQADA